MKPKALLLALALCALLGCSVNDDPVYSPVYPCPSFSDARPASAMPNDGDSDANGPVGDPSNDDPSAIDAGESHAGRYGGDYGVSRTIDRRTKDVIALSNECLKLEAAIKEFAARAGRYPEDVDADWTPDGETVVDLLPELPRNPYTGERAAPVSHSAVLPGQIGYAIVHAETRNPRATEGGYVITARTKHEGTIAHSNLPYSTIELVVLSHARTVQLAAERFARENYGIYSADVSSNMTRARRTLTDLLPQGLLLENPTLRQLTEPVDGSAVNPGQIGYMPACDGGMNLGYSITGVGTDPGTVIVIIARDPWNYHSN